MISMIAELKLAVERKFSHLPTKGPGKISWGHVWGHFCLSYHGHKLLHDSDFIKDYGIKDGDRLRFVRHVSMSYNLVNKWSRKRIEAPKPITIADYDEDYSPKSEAYDDIEDLRRPNNSRNQHKDWPREVREGFKNSDLSKQCLQRYKIYMEGNAWSVNGKYILACDAMTLLQMAPVTQMKLLHKFQRQFARIDMTVQT